MTQYNATVVYRVRYVDWLSEARVAQVQRSRPARRTLLIFSRFGTIPIAERRRYLILEGKAFD